MAREVHALQQGVGPHQTVITTQQNYARSFDAGPPRSAAADISRKPCASARRAAIAMASTVARHFDDIGTHLLDKHKLLQILVNLISNDERAVKDHRIDANPDGSRFRSPLTTIRKPVSTACACRLRIAAYGISPRKSRQALSAMVSPPRRRARLRPARLGQRRPRNGRSAHRPQRWTGKRRRVHPRLPAKKVEDNAHARV